jgi:hypothetical protein
MLGCIRTVLAISITVTAEAVPVVVSIFVAKKVPLVVVSVVVELVESVSITGRAVVVVIIVVKSEMIAWKSSKLIQIRIIICICIVLFKILKALHNESV